MKKLLSIVMIMMLMLALVACGNSTTTTTTEGNTEAVQETTAAPTGTEMPLKGKLMGVVTPSADHGFTAESIQHCEAQVKALSAEYGFDYKFMTAAESGEQSNAIDTILAMEPDVFVLWPVNGDELKSAAQTIQEAGVPLIIYDRMISDFTPTSTLMGDNDAIGEGAGEYFNAMFATELAAGKVNLLLFEGDSSSVPLQRTNGFKKTANPNFNIVQSFETNWSQQTAMEQMESYLTTKTKEEIESIQAIFTHDDEIVFGIVEALKNYDGDAKINIKLISGVAASSGFMDIIEDSGLDGIEFMTYTFSPSMVRDAVDLGLKVLQGETLDADYLVPTSMVDKTNYKEYMESDIYKIRYSLGK